MPCLVQNKKGECRWEKDGDPVGMYPTKYEWAGSPEEGDCSLRILDASLEFDDGVWQCQVTPTSFLFKDSLISEGAELVVRGKQKANIGTTTFSYAMTKKFVPKCLSTQSCVHDKSFFEGSFLTPSTLALRALLRKSVVLHVQG